MHTVPQRHVRVCCVGVCVWVCCVHVGVLCGCTCVWGCTVWVYVHVGCAMQVCVHVGYRWCLSGSMWVRGDVVATKLRTHQWGECGEVLCHVLPILCVACTRYCTVRFLCCVSRCVSSMSYITLCVAPCVARTCVTHTECCAIYYATHHPHHLLYCPSPTPSVMPPCCAILSHCLVVPSVIGAICCTATCRATAHCCPSYHSCTVVLACHLYTEIV